MANFREHITVSSMLGLSYGLSGVMGFGFNPVQGLLAACLTGLSGMLPDLDSDGGRPVREMFGLLGAVAPLLVVNRVIAFLGLTGDPETIMLVIVLLYVSIKYGGAEFISRVSVHRGMFHSLPALLIAAEAVFLAYPSPRLEVKLFMGGGVAIGFLSHLLLDELYSVEVKGSRLGFKRSSGTAMKWSGDALIPNVVAFTLMATLTYAVFEESGWLEQQSVFDQRAPSAGSPGESWPGAKLAPMDGGTVELGTPIEVRGMQTVQPTPEVDLGSPQTAEQFPPTLLQR
ncbi:MAG: metal-dependent hydrolase [Planctomycetaceae bacterium]